MDKFMKALDFDSDTLGNVKRDMNFVLQRLIGNMMEKGSTNGSLTLKIDVSFTQEYIPNYDPKVEGESRKINKPSFRHKVTSTVQITDKKDGNMDTEMELAFDEDSGEYVLQPVANTTQTELEFAYNRGADQGVRQAQSQGLIGKTIKRWITSGDDSVCSICAALDGTEIEMDDNFDFKGRLLFAGQKMLPPAHPRCACAVEYIEIEPPVFQPENMTEIETEVNVEEQKEFSSGEEAEEYFGKRPDRSLRRSDREEYDRQLDYFKTQSPYGKWSQQTTSQEEASITNYCGPDYSAINGLLRREMTENQVKLWDDLGNRKISEMISDISSAISKFELPEDIKVFRTCENDVLEKLQTKIGSTFHDDGFVSTSVVREKQASGNIFMEISVPKGQGVGAWVNPLSGKPEEYEFLLNRGTDFLVTDIGQDGADTIIRMKVTGRTETEWSYATKEEVIEQWKRRGVYSEESAKLL